jgi:hypothetical protein
VQCSRIQLVVATTLSLVSVYGATASLADTGDRTQASARNAIEKKYEKNHGHLTESPFAPWTPPKGTPPPSILGQPSSRTQQQATQQHPQTGEALASAVRFAIALKDYKSLYALNAMQTFDSGRVESIQKMEKALLGTIKVKSVIFSSKLVDNQDHKIDPSDGDLLINFEQASPFPLHGNATMGNVTQVKFPAMKIGGYYQIHGKRGFGMSDFGT